MKLYVFNSDTDMALASNEENYIAPASARRMAQDLALLPVWYVQPGSCLLYTSDAADDMQCVDLGGRRIIKKIFFSSRRRHTR